MVKASKLETFLLSTGSKNLLFLQRDAKQPWEREGVCFPNSEFKIKDPPTQKKKETLEGTEELDYKNRGILRSV